MEYLIVFLVGIAGGLVGSLSSGGGLITIPLLLVLGHPPIPVIATTRLGSLSGSLSSLLSYAQKGGLINWRYVTLFSLPSLVAGIIGARILISIDQNFVATFVGIILLVLSLLLLFAKGYGVVSKPKRKHHAILGAILLPLSMVYAVMFGAGGGLLVINIMLACFGLIITEATATAMAIWVIGTASASVVYIISGNVLYNILPELLAGSIIGGYIGAKVALQKDNIWLKRALGIVVFASSLKMLLF